MKTIILCLIVLSNSVALFGQNRQQFDIATFAPPAGWQSETTDFASSYTSTNNLTGGWCRASIYKSIVSSGIPLTDFNNEWGNLIAKAFPDAALPTPEASTEEGWTSQAGVSKFQYNNQEAVAMLTTVTGYGVEMSFVVLMNSDEFILPVESFLGSIDLIKPAIKSVVQEKQPTTPAQSVPPIIEKLSNNHGISISTINFDDGWIAQPFDDYVKVIKGQTTVLLHYGIEITDAMRNSNDIAAALWNQIIAPRYTTSNVRKFDNGGACYFCIDFLEADAIEKLTGKNCLVGFRMITTNGVSKCIEIITPSSPDFQQMFPDQKKIEALLNYNKFAVTEKDLVGTWEETSGAYVNMYSTVTGAYAGMNSASSAHKFIFKPKGQYESFHSGASGMVGSMQFYSQKYNGASTITNWDITLTKRFNGKTEVFWAQFEAVRGGRVLHLVNKASDVLDYHLVKTQ
ncbi:hypothetical protein BH09BAC3_BH09BAC3_25380 [soil metagenome]